MPLKVEFVTPSKHVLSAEFESVLAPGVLGEFEVLPGHASLLTALGSGNVILKNSTGQNTTHAIPGGILEVAHDQVKILADD